MVSRPTPARASAAAWKLPSAPQPAMAACDRSRRSCPVRLNAGEENLARVALLLQGGHAIEVSPLPGWYQSCTAAYAIMILVRLPIPRCTLLVLMAAAAMAPARAQTPQTPQQFEGKIDRLHPVRSRAAAARSGGDQRHPAAQSACAAAHGGRARHHQPSLCHRRVHRHQNRCRAGRRSGRGSHPDAEQLGSSAAWPPRGRFRTRPIRANSSMPPASPWASPIRTTGSTRRWTISKSCLPPTDCTRQSIEPRYDYDSERQQVNLTFTVTSGSRARFSTPDLEGGDLKLPPEKIITATKWRRWAPLRRLRRNMETRHPGARPSRSGRCGVALSEGQPAGIEGFAGGHEIR